MNFNVAGNFQVRLMPDIDRSINLKSFEQFRNVFFRRCQSFLSQSMMSSSQELNIRKFSSIPFPPSDKFQENLTVPQVQR